MSVDLGDLERPEADGIIGVAEPGRREVDAKPAAKLQQRTCADGLSRQRPTDSISSAYIKLRGVALRRSRLAVRSLCRKLLPLRP